MDRTRNIFITLIALTLFIGFGATLFSKFSAEKPIEEINETNETNVQPQVSKGELGILIASSNTKKAWLDQLAADFNAQRFMSSESNIIVVKVQHVTSGGSMNAILDGSLKPTAWSPGDQSWVAQANEQWQQRNNKPIASQACEATIYAPLGFAMWRPMAEALGWPDTPIGWDTIVELAADPEGWGSYGRPEWGQFRFGHTHPGYANSGLLSMTAFMYGVSSKGINLTATDIYADEVETAMRALENNTAKYGKQAPALLNLMVKEGTSYLHAAAVPEADTVRYNIEHGDELDLPLAFIFPSGGTIWADHPYCVLDNAEWVSAEQAQAAQAFQTFLLNKENQALAIDNYLRPLDNSIALHAPLSLENGTDPRVSPATIPALPSPSAEISAAVTEMFLIAKRKATVMLVIDVSGSMRGDKIKTVREATVEFLSRLDPDDSVGLMIFNKGVSTLLEPTRVGDVAESLGARISSLVAEGDTNLYGAVCDAVEQMNALRIADAEADISRLYGVVLLSDGEDTIGAVRENQMFATCLPDNVEADGVKIFPIAFGEGADQSVLERIADVTAGRLFSADPSSIDKVYVSISAEQ